MIIQTNYSEWNVKNLVENKYTLGTVQAQRKQIRDKAIVEFLFFILKRNREVYTLFCGPSAFLTNFHS